MVDIPRDYGQAGSAEHDSHTDAAGIGAALRAAATDLQAALGTDNPDWETAIAVASNTVTLDQPGYVLHVHATTGSSAGPKRVVSSGTPSAGQVRVTYADGVPTLLFAVADAITVCAVHQIRRPEGYTEPQLVAT